jgi:hypothetical protein
LFFKNLLQSTNDQSTKTQGPKFEGKTATHYYCKVESKTKNEAHGCYKAQRKFFLNLNQNAYLTFSKPCGWISILFKPF